jgi:adenylate cyclase
MIRFADSALKYAEGIQLNDTTKLQFRVGIHVGQVVAGMIGKSKPYFDLWGDNVNHASRMESTGKPMRIQVSDDVKQLVVKYFSDTFSFEDRGEIEVKGKGKVRTHFVVPTYDGNE